MKKLLLSALVISSGFLTSQVNLTSSLTGCYDFNGQANDAINALNGTLTGVSPTTDRSNNAGSALSFQGNASSYVALPNDPGLKPATDISISGWVMPYSVNQNMTIVFAKNTFPSFHTAYGMALENSGGLKFLAVRQNG